MSNGNFPNLGALDDFARDLFRHAKSAGPEFADIAIAVRRLHGVLKHLKVEAEDPDSLLNSHDAAVYNRQLAPLVEDCDFNLKQLETILKKYGDVDRLEERERDMIDMIRTKLANQKTSIDMFLDTIQLQNPTKAQRIVNEQGGNLDNIKDKVDAIAARLFARRHSGVGDDDEDLWQQFRTELEREGFSKEVLRKNKVRTQHTCPMENTTPQIPSYRISRYMETDNSHRRSSAHIFVSLKSPPATMPWLLPPSAACSLKNAAKPTAPTTTAAKPFPPSTRALPSLICRLNTAPCRPTTVKTRWTITTIPLP